MVHWVAIRASLVLAGVVASTLVAAEDVRRFEFAYTATIGPFDAVDSPVDVFVPLAVSSDRQRLLGDEIDAPVEGRIEREAVYGNRYWHGRFEPEPGAQVTVRVTTRVERPVSARPAPTESRPLTAPERARFARYLEPNARVVVDHPMLDPIRDEIRGATATGDPARTVRGIYDWVSENVEYKKIGTGWGNGDTFWACNERYGNCTDFHALFISLARSEGIPARFEMGFPVPSDRADGRIAGYHCWVRFYLPEAGWLPIDASEASKHPEQREALYGAQPADRIHFSTGRDLRLGERHRGRALNYFVYPYVEVDGKPFEGPIERAFSYRES